ncbi:hypothetical protein [Micromonospora sp. C41]|uniref:hypothetical protein n=1 Tax=Micromonospora sp. C41 TaxID=2824878 RepID=UPI001B383B79|nr:hypothetical protein [Micromonospora sp. C41]MBQ1060058.1 hypothetical protein [Micromonospora sp. C41]
MARRRDLAAEAARGSEEPPECLRSMRGVNDFREQAYAEPIPEWVQPGEVKGHRALRAYVLWHEARKAWCVERGLDWYATFHSNREVVDRPAGVR